MAAACYGFCLGLTANLLFDVFSGPWFAVVGIGLAGLVVGRLHSILQHASRIA